MRDLLRLINKMRRSMYGNRLSAPNFQMCIDKKCPLYKKSSRDCKTLKIGECEHEYEHYSSDRDNQLIDGKRHGRWVEGDKVSYWNYNYCYGGSMSGVYLKPKKKRKKANKNDK